MAVVLTEEQARRVGRVVRDFESGSRGGRRGRDKKTPRTSGGGGPRLALLESDLRSNSFWGSAPSAKARLYTGPASDDLADEEIDVSDALGFSGNPIRAGRRVWVAKHYGRWVVVNAAGDPGCASEEEGDCGCGGEDEEEDE